MKFNNHPELIGSHAFLGASKYHWINYDDQKLALSFNNFIATQRGTELHEFAETCIRLGQKLPDSPKTLNMYVNDAIGFKMTPEQVLFYSENCFGTADAILFQKDMLRIHDLKTGENDTSFRQLEIYAALFCLEYHFKPEELAGIELRIYQNNEVRQLEPDPMDIRAIMDKIILFDQHIEKLKFEG